MSVRIIEGDSSKVELSPNHFDTLITDPPYGLGFMGKDWDYGVPGVRFWQKFLMACKPGAIALVFGGTRTHHRLMCAMEDAGWEIRDCMMWLYGSGFPKSLDISKAIDKAKKVERSILSEKPAYGIGGVGGNRSGKYGGHSESATSKITAPATDLAKLWEGYGTALKPAWEPIIVAMKPLDGTFAHNAEKWGVGGLWIDGGRIDYQGETPNMGGRKNAKMGGEGYGFKVEGRPDKPNTQGRWPANLILDEEAGAMLDKQSGISKSMGKRQGEVSKTSISRGKISLNASIEGISHIDYSDSGGASRFFYCSKASKKERNDGCEGVTTWENVGLKDNLNGVVSLVKDISEDTMCLPNDCECCMILFGRTTLDQSQQNLMFIIKTMTKQIIRLKTLSCNPNLPTRDYILGVIKMLQDNGLNPAVSAENISQLIPSITNEKMASVLGVVVAVLQMLSKISERGKQGNIHSTVKPLALMEYLCKLTRTPTGGVVLDPFGGSGTTALACINTERDCVIIEKKPEYCEIIKARTKADTIERQASAEKEKPLIPVPGIPSSHPAEARQRIIEEALKKLRG